MFDFNEFNNAEPLPMYLCRPNNKVICELNGVEDDTTSLTINLNNQYEFTFDYDKYIMVDDEQVLANGFNKLSFGMKILVPKIGFFRMEHPVYNYDGEKIVKSITAYSIDCELEDKGIYNFKVNTGEKTSFEYLVQYEDGETESLLNEYTGIPYDYILFDNTFPDQLRIIRGKYSDGTYTDSDVITEIKQYCDLIPRLKSRIITSDDSSSIEEYVSYTYDSSGENIIGVELYNFNARIDKLIDFYTKYHDQLSLVSLVLKNHNCDWEVGEIDPDLANKKFKFDIDGSNVYGFLTQDVASAAECVFQFDLFRKKVNAILIKNIGKDSGVFIDRANLLNTLEINCEDTRLYTRYTVSGADDLGIEYVNFGSNRITDLTYFMKVRDQDGDLIYVTDELAQKYEQYKADVEIAREKYIELSKEYNQLLIDIDELKYKMPNDVVKTEWGNFTAEELEAAETSYTNLLNTLLTLYKEDYGTAGCNDDGSVKESVIKESIYWVDYVCYNQALEQIKQAALALQNGSNYSKIDNEEIKASIEAYKTEWTLYGTSELQCIISTYDEQMKALVQAEDIVLKSNSEAPKKWSELTDAEKSDFNCVDINYNINYDQYIKAYNERNDCQKYLDTLLSELSKKENELQNFQDQRSNLAKLVTIEGYNRDKLGEIVALENPDTDSYFTTDEIRTLNLLYVDTEYSNENILTTSLNNVVTTVDVQRDLLKDAQEKISIASQPQTTFSVDIDDILCMPEFKDYEFIPGNYVYVEYQDDYYVKLRLCTMEFNPRIPTIAPKITFTNYAVSNSKRNDLSFLLGESSGGSSGGSSSGGSSGGGTYGESDDIDVTVSNTMLAKLLNTEMFGSRVSNVVLDTLKLNTINAKTATFGGLSDGTTTIDGRCLTTGWIISNDYDGDKAKGTISNTKGSIINLTNGYFNFGGGKLTWNGTILSVTGDVTTGNLDATGGTIGGFTIGTNKIYATGTDGYTIAMQKWVDGENKWVFAAGGKDHSNYADCPFRVSYDGSLYATKATIKGEINATSGTIGGCSISDGVLQVKSANITEKLTADKLNVTSLSSISANLGSITAGSINIGSGKFTVTSDGVLTATGATISGTLTAGAGSKIGGWTIGAGKIYGGAENSNQTTVMQVPSDSTTYVFAAGGNSHDSYSDCPFRVTKNGKLTAEDATILGSITATTLKAKSAFKLYEQNSSGDTKTFNVIKSVNSTGWWDANNYEIDFGLGDDINVIRFEKDASAGSHIRIGWTRDDGKLSASYVTNGIGIYGQGLTLYGLDTIDISSDGSIDISANSINIGIGKVSMGYTNDSYKLAVSSFICDGHVRTTGSYGWISEDHKGGWYMKDDTWIRSYGSKSIYHDSGILRTDGTLQVGASGAYFSSNSSMTKIQNLRFLDWNESNQKDPTYRRPTSSASTDGNRVGYISSKINSSGTYYLTVQGQYGTTGTTYETRNFTATTSDIRLKKNIADTNKTAMPIINQMKLRQFDWISGAHQDLGFVADELELLDSRLTIGGGKNKDGSMNVKSIDTLNLLAYVVKGIQEMYQELEELKEENKILRESIKK